MLLLPLLACDSDGPASAPPTWNADVASIVGEHCGGCHTSGGIAPFALDDYATAAPMAASMVAAIDAGTMPPWGAESTDECEPRFGFQNDMRLSDDEKALLFAWAAADAPEGAATDAPLPEPPVLDLEDATQEVGVAVGYVASGNSDEFRCFSIDPGLTQDAWLTGLQVLPGNPEVVHHVLVFSDPAAESAGLVGDDGTYDCFGGSGLSEGGALLGAWAPGAFPFESPAGTGIPVTAGSLIVMQIHYHPAGSTAEPDASALQLRWQTDAPANEAVLALIGNASSADQGLLDGTNDRGGVPEFFIPAGAEGHTETIRYTLGRGDGPFQVFMAGTHMHYVGTDMRITVERTRADDGEPASECLVQTPRWDFNWQRAYSYAAPLADVPVIEGGDTLVLRCTYDNTTDNPGVRQALTDAGLDAPQDVFLGESTLDEMCLGVFGIVY